MTASRPLNQYAEGRNPNSENFSASRFTERRPYSTDSQHSRPQYEIMGPKTVSGEDTVFSANSARQSSVESAPMKNGAEKKMVLSLF